MSHRYSYSRALCALLEWVHSRDVSPNIYMGLFVMGLVVHLCTAYSDGLPYTCI